jgi:hypothetical protein
MKITNTFYDTSQTRSARTNSDQKKSSGFDDILNQTGFLAPNAPKVPDAFHETEGTDGLSATDSGQSDNDKLLADFAKWSKMSPSERIRAQYLEAHGITETTLSQLDPDVQKAIEDAIKQSIKQQLDKQTQQDGGSTLLAPSL